MRVEENVEKEAILEATTATGTHPVSSIMPVASTQRDTM